MNLLIIEDIPFRQDFIKSKLETLNFENIDCVDNSKTATHFLKENKYDIVFFDYDLVGAKTS